MSWLWFDATGSPTLLEPVIDDPEQSNSVLPEHRLLSIPYTKDGYRCHVIHRARGPFRMKSIVYLKPEATYRQVNEWMQTECTHIRVLLHPIVQGVVMSRSSGGRVDPIWLWFGSLGFTIRITF